MKQLTDKEKLAKVRLNEWMRRYRKALKKWERGGASIRELSRQSGVAVPTLRDWRDGKCAPTLSRAYAVEAALGMETGE